MNIEKHYTYVLFNGHGISEFVHFFHTSLSLIHDDYTQNVSGTGMVTNECLPNFSF